ncbi:hypothetical protein [Jannaschia sp. S6380]|uniref:hypothetical protein n=1 Tax=Jannaschia sp. S6380 TaxID=2926408 RepID=UPI0032B1333A
MTTVIIRIDDPESARGKPQGAERMASLYCMSILGHLCPFGMKPKPLLERREYRVDGVVRAGGPAERQ